MKNGAISFGRILLAICAIVAVVALLAAHGLNPVTYVAVAVISIYGIIRLFVNSHPVWGLLSIFFPIIGIVYGVYEAITFA